MRASWFPQHSHFPTKELSIMKLFKTLAAALPVAALLSAPVQAADIKVGSAGGVTGPIAELVAAIMKGRQLAADNVNSNGGLLKGDMLKLVIADSACDPKAAVDAGNKLVNVEQVVAIIGPSCSGATNGLVSSVAIPAGVTVLSDSATAPSISELKDKDLVFRASASDAYQGAEIANLIYKAGIRKVAVTYSNDDYNAGIASVFAKSFKGLGGTITANQAHEPNKASYRSEMATLSQGGPEAMALFAYYGSSGITIVKNSLENGLFDKFYAADGMFDVSVIAQIGADNLRGKLSITQAASDSDDASYQAFASAYTAAGGDPAAPYAAHGYDVAFLMALAIEKAGSADRSKISAALRAVAGPTGEVVRPGEWAKAKALIAAGKDVNYEGAAGPNDFDANGDVTGLFSLNVVGADGKWSREMIK
jgi:branched-chain amino acid transport system substrate-binding protein